jgi:hypothetical protein
MSSRSAFKFVHCLASRGLSEAGMSSAARATKRVTRRAAVELTDTAAERIRELLALRHKVLNVLSCAVYGAAGAGIAAESTHGCGSRVPSFHCF